MASRIQGITVEIGGDTTKLTTALKSVNGEIRNTQSQLRDVEKLLKLDPGNTELLSQKQRLLNEEVQTTKEKLEALKTASEQANAALEQGTITQSQYDGLQREIIATEAALKDLEEQAEQSAVALQKISATGTKFQEVGGKIEGVGKTLLPVSAAVTGVGVAGLKVATDFEKAMSGVQAITGATGEDFEKLRETAIDLGASTAFSSGEVAEAMTEMAKAGWSTSQIIEGMSGLISLLNLSQEEYDALSDSMNNCSGIAGETAGVMQDNLQSKVEQLGGALESLAIKLSEYVIPFLTGLVERSLRRWMPLQI